MNLYYVSQEYDGYETYDGFVVACETEEDARNTHPQEGRVFGKDCFTWCQTPSEVDVKFIGVAGEETKKGVILASFNAG